VGPLRPCIINPPSPLDCSLPSPGPLSHFLTPYTYLLQPLGLYIVWLDLLAVHGTLKSLLQHHSSKASVLWCSAFFIAQLSHPYMTMGKTIALTRWTTFVSKVMFLLFNVLSRFVIAFRPRSKFPFISWLRSSATVILEPKKMRDEDA